MHKNIVLLLLAGIAVFIALQGIYIPQSIVGGNGTRIGPFALAFSVYGDCDFTVQKGAVLQSDEEYSVGEVIDYDQDELGGGVMRSRFANDLVTRFLPRQGYSSASVRQGSPTDFYVRVGAGQPAINNFRELETRYISCFRKFGGSIPDAALPPWEATPIPTVQPTPSSVAGQLQLSDFALLAALLVVGFVFASKFLR